jgi:uncharacterized protein YPO0396
VDSTIEFKGNAMITGDNGAGKSTILDAIQFVLCGGKTKFNQAAHERAKRDLLGYVRCKTGKEDNEYERTGDVTSHVAIEFYEEKKKKYFIIGTVIDSAGTLSHPKVIFYRIENRKLSDDLFFKGNIPRNISDFRIHIKGMDSKFMTTITEMQKDLGHRFGALNNRFFDLLPKALAFRPIENVKDFVYSYILDKKEVNIEYLKENVRTYLEFEKVLKEIKNKLNFLGNIDEYYKDVIRIEENIKIQDYIIHRSSKELEDSKLKEKDIEEKVLKEKFKSSKEREIVINSDLQKARALQDEIHFSLLHNDTYNLMNNLRNEIDRLNMEYLSMQQKERSFDEILKKEIRRAKDIYDKGYSLKGMDALANISKDVFREDNTKDFVEKLIELEDEYKTLYEDNKTKEVEARLEQQKYEKELENVENDIRSLESKQLVYEDNIIKLKESIRDGIKAEKGIDYEPRIICELLHINDPVWKDAVEGYLNTQRFNLIVNPEHFDAALGIYERVKSKKHVYGVGLINTQKLDEYSDCSEDSLACVVTSENRFAKLYANMILGKVVRCSDVNDLKKYKTSITATCMVYQNNTARQINPSIYRKPYIGEDAYKTQLELKKKDREDLKLKISSDKNVLSELKIMLNLLIDVKLDYLRENSSVKYDTAQKKLELSQKTEALKRIDMSTIMQLQMEEKSAKDKIKSLEEQKENVMRENIQLEVNISNIERLISEHKASVIRYSEVLSRYEEVISPLLARARDKYDESLKNKKLETVLSNFLSSKKGLETSKENELIKLRNLQLDYNREFHFGGSEGLEGMPEFHREYRNLKDSKIIEYEEKIRLARQKAEEEFKDHFISKLQENIVSAQKEFKKLNDALRGIKFGEDEYKFEFRESRDNKKFYDMIMDDSNFGGDTLFTEIFRQKHREAIDELFERITIDDDQSKKALDKFTDYRTYMDYDIKILQSNGSTLSFSKVCREKSGGETQTPYYVAIVASFIQMYGNCLHEETVGVIMFDEAFDKMDENRIESMMNFLNNLKDKLQVIIAAPPQKIEIISKHVSSTLVVTKEDNFSWVEGLYFNEELQ